MAFAGCGRTTLGKYATNANSVEMHVFFPGKSYK